MEGNIEVPLIRSSSNVKRCGYMRYVLVFVCMLTVAILLILRTVISVCIVAMTNDETLLWNDMQRGTVLSAFFWGYFAAMVPGGASGMIFGAKKCIVIALSATSIISIASPTIAQKFGFVPFVVLRALDGVFQALIFPSVYHCVSAWSPQLESTIVATVIESGQFSGTIIAMSVSGMLIGSSDWTYPFYAAGFGGIICALAWLILGSDYPENHPFISSQEAEYIQQTRGAKPKRIRLKEIPWKSILTSMPVHAVILAHFCERWGYYTLMTELPNFLSSSFKFDIRTAGLLSMIPFAVIFIFMLSSGQIVDYIRTKDLVSTTALRKFCTCFAFTVAALFMALCGLTSNPALNITFLSIGIGFSGISYSGFYTNTLEVAPQLTSIILSFSNNFATLPGILSPLVTEFVNKGTEDWAAVFYLTALVYMFGCLFYARFASAKAQPWAHFT